MNTTDHIVFCWETIASRLKLLSIPLRNMIKCQRGLKILQILISLTYHWMFLKNSDWWMHHHGSELALICWDTDTWPIRGALPVMSCSRMLAVVGPALARLNELRSGGFGDVVGSLSSTLCWCWMVIGLYGRTTAINVWVSSFMGRITFTSMLGLQSLQYRMNSVIHFSCQWFQFFG